MKFRRLLLCVASATAAAVMPVAPVIGHANAAILTGTWSAFESAPGNYDGFLYGGVATGDLLGNGQQDVVVGFPDGAVKVYRATDGAVLWAIQTDGQISDTPTLADLYNNGQEEVIVTTRNGSVYVWSPTGQAEPGWPQRTQDGIAQHTGFPDAFAAGVAVGQIFGDGRNFLVSEGWDHYLYVWGVDGRQANGFPVNLADTAWTTPVLVPNAGNPTQDDIIAGADSDGGLEPYAAGGEYFRFTNKGCPEVNYLIDNSNNLKQKNLKGSNACQAAANWPVQISNTAWSSPTVFDNNGSWDTVLGSGQYFNTGNPKDCGATIDPPDCGRSFRLVDPAGNVIWTHPAAHGQVLTTAAVGYLRPGDDGHDIVITDNGLEGGGSCLYAVDSAGADLFAPVCGGIVQWSQPTIGPVDARGHNGIWIGQGGFLDSYDSYGNVLTSTPFGDGTGYLPGAPAIFNDTDAGGDGRGAEVAAMGADTKAGGNYNQWQVSVFPVSPDRLAVNTTGMEVYPRYHGDSNNDGREQMYTATSVPYNLAATAGDGSASVSFTQPSDVGSALPTSYDVLVLDKNGNQVSMQSVSGSAAQQLTVTANITGLTNGKPYYFRVRADNGASSDWSVPTYSVTPYPATPPAAALDNTIAATAQYQLPNSDGSTWQDIDPTKLAFTLTPSTTGSYVITGNADLWTSTSGINQDVGICVVSGSTNCNSSPADIIAWKESGGNAGTFSPNAAAVQGVASLTSGTAYTVKLVWKSNRPALGASIWAAAGGTGAFSPTRLSARSLDVLASVSSSQQQHLDGSDGSTWVQMAPSGLSTSFSTQPGADTLAVLSANADLWTATPGYNQDVGILVTSSSDSSYGSSGRVVAWKESGGFAGRFSPNAAYLDTAINVLPATSYTATLVWKSNKPMGLGSGDGIYFGAGSSPGFSPTTLVAMQPSVPLSGRVVAYPVSSQVSTQHSMTGNRDQWTPLDDSHYEITLSPPVSGCLTVVSVNADLWTGNAGFNQDLGIDVAGSSAPVAWKESGGFAGTFSPNAAFVEYQFTASSGDVVRVVWKSNVAGGATIVAGAGHGPGFSPTTLLVQYLC